MSTTINLNTIGKDMDWTWPYMIDVNNVSVYKFQDWSNIRTAYQNLGNNSPGDYFVYDEMHPNGICMYEKLPKVSTSNDPENSVWVPLTCSGTAYDGATTISDGCVYINYYLVPTTNTLREASSLSLSLSFGDCITVYIVDGVFDHAVLNESSSGSHR